MTTQILQFNPNNIEICAREILSGGIVAFPTETVYGLGANALDGSAVKKIYAAKGRPSDNPLICHISDKAQIEKIAFLTPMAEKLIDAFMPGPLTVVLKKREIVPSVVTGGLDTVGIRMPSHKVALELISACNVPICAPSANTSTKPSPTTAKHVLDDMGGKIKYILDGGQCKVGLESTIIDCVGGKILRYGGLPKETIEEVVGKISPPPNSDIPLCPGMKYKHYSPKAEVILAMPRLSMRDIICENYDSTTKKTVILTLGGDYGKRDTRNMGKTTDEYAHNLFQAFRALDDDGYERIICEGVNDDGIGAALMNRLIKASGGKTI